MTTSSPVFTFGGHRGKTVDEVAGIDPGYLEWLLTTDIVNRYDVMGAASKPEQKM
jgi:hypothetical protein